MTIERVIKVKVFWKCSRGHMHTQKDAAEKCEWTRLSRIEKAEAVRQNKLERARVRAEKDAALLAKRKRIVSMVESGWLAGLSVRVARIIENEGMKSTQEIRERSDAEWMRTPCMGRLCLCELKQWLAHLPEGERMAA